MPKKSESVNRKILRTLIELKQPSETVSDFIGRLLEQSSKQSAIVEQHQKMQNLLKLYIPENVISDFISEQEALMVRQNRLLAIMFADIRSFTSISENRLPEELFNDLNSYFRLMADILYANSGIIDKYIGDAILAYFGYPVSSEETALRAVLAGIEMLDAIKKRNSESSKAGLPPYNIGIGINIGIVTIGNIGHPELKLNFTVLGDMVNLASRMESLTSTYKQEILITESVYFKIKDILPCRLVDMINIAGKEQSIRIFTTKKELSQQEQASWNIHNRAMNDFYSNNIEAAFQSFQEVLKYQENDHLANMMIERCIKRKQ